MEDQTTNLGDTRKETMTYLYILLMDLYHLLILAIRIFAVYVQVVDKDIQKLENDHLVYMGGQRHIFCRKYQLPLISLSKRDSKCTVIDLAKKT